MIFGKSRLMSEPDFSFTFVTRKLLYNTTLSYVNSFSRSFPNHRHITLQCGPPCGIKIENLSDRHLSLQLKGPIGQNCERSCICTHKHRFCVAFLIYIYKDYLIGLGVSDHEFAGLNLGTSIILIVDYVWNSSTLSREGNWVAI